MTTAGNIDVISIENLQNKEKCLQRYHTPYDPIFCNDLINRVFLLDVGDEGMRFKRYPWLRAAAPTD